MGSMSEYEFYRCDICDHKQRWDEIDDVYGDMWGCEECGLCFCTRCFVAAYDTDKYWEMMRDHDLIRCPECFSKHKNIKMKGDLNGG